MKQSIPNCPKCGQQATGKFCASCGTALGGWNCSRCRSPLGAGARFCSNCGSPTSAGDRGLGLTSLPWMIAGVAVIALAVALALRTEFGRRPQRATAAPRSAAAPDISNLTPREQADRLFNRMMSAAEQGNPAELVQFKPMALAAYAQLGTLDSDARYHVALILLHTNEPQAALAYADSIDAGAPGHLFASIIQHTVARLNGDDAGTQRAYRAFLANYEDQIGTGRREYAEHERTLADFHRRARAAKEE